MPGTEFDIGKAVAAIISAEDSTQQQDAAYKLFRYLSENLSALPPVPPQLPCVLAIDPALEPVLNFVQALLPENLKARTTARICDSFSDLVKLTQESLPALLIFTSNFLVRPGVEAMSALVATSPGTRYLVATGWHDVEIFHRVADALRVHIEVLPMPFGRAQFLAALTAAEPPTL